MLKYRIAIERGLVSIFWEGKLVGLGATIDVAIQNIPSGIIRNRIRRDLEKV